MRYFYDSFGVRRKWSDIRLVEELVNLKKHSGSNPWPVIEKCFEVWEKTNPTRYQSHLLEIQEIRNTRKSRKYAQVHDKKNDGYLRYILDIPEKVEYMIRALYTPDELPMNLEYYREFARRFPKYKVAEQL